MDFNKSNKIYTPMLSLSGKLFYSKRICDGLSSILYRASNYAHTHKEILIEKGRNLTVEISGKINKNARYTFFIYHVPVEQENTNTLIQTFDIPKIELQNADRVKLLRMSIKSIIATNPDAQIVLLTNKSFGTKLSDMNISLLFPDVDSSLTMYSRAKTYNTIVQKDIVGGKVVFMDSDTMVLRSLSNLRTNLSNSITLTRRFAPNLMPINESLMIINSHREYAKDFFSHLMGTYEWIKNDNVIKGIVGLDLRRWRGGILSLNAICPGIRNTTFLDSNKDITILPSEKYHHTPPSLSAIKYAITGEEIFSIHLKGNVKDRKSNLEKVENLLDEYIQAYRK